MNLLNQLLLMINILNIMKLLKFKKKLLTWRKM